VSLVYDFDPPSAFDAVLRFCERVGAVLRETNTHLTISMGKLFSGLPDYLSEEASLRKT
jgi:hypothetical protein